MIAIDVKMFSIDGKTLVTESNLIANVNKEYEKIINFFQECVDQSMVLNLAVYKELVDHDITTYFASDMAKAELFEQKFQDLTAEFSMRKFWNQYGFDVSISKREIDFDAEMMSNTSAELVNKENSTLWGILYPK